jgi:hypothetical protein
MMSRNDGVSCLFISAQNGHLEGTLPCTLNKNPLSPRGRCLRPQTGPRYRRPQGALHRGPWACSALASQHPLRTQSSV